MKKIYFFILAIIATSIFANATPTKTAIKANAAPNIIIQNNIAGIIMGATIYDTGCGTSPCTPTAPSINIWAPNSVGGG